MSRRTVSKNFCFVFHSRIHCSVSTVSLERFEMGMCTIGDITGSQDCHSKTFSTNQLLHPLDTLTPEEKELLHLRIDEFHPSNEGTICDFHKLKYLEYYSKNVRYCFDPLTKHKKTDLRILDLQTCKEFSTSELTVTSKKLIPGNKVCGNCQKCIRSKLMKQETKETISPEPEQNVPSPKFNLRPRDHLADSNKASQNSESSDSTIQRETSDSSCSIFSQDWEKVDNALAVFGIPSMNLKKIPINERPKKVEVLLEKVVLHIGKKISNIFGVQLPQVQASDVGLIQDSSSLGAVLRNLQEAFRTAKNTKEKLEYLILLLHQWNRKRINNYFSCSDWMYEKLKVMRKTGSKYV